MNECIICMDEINNINFIKMPCCNAAIHKTCIQEWIIFNIDNNSEINKCIYCKQNTLFYDNIIKQTIDIQKNNYILIDVSSNIQHCYRSYIYVCIKYKLIFYFFILSAIIIISIIIIPVITTNNF